MTAALEGGERSAARPGHTLPQGKTLYPFYRRLGGPQGRSGQAENLIPTRIRSRTIQPVVSRYTDWATRPTARLGPEIDSQACLRVLHGTHHNTWCCFSIQNFNFLIIFCLETPKKGSGPTKCRTEPLLSSLSVILFPLTPACPTACRDHSKGSGPMKRQTEPLLLSLSAISFPLTPACPRAQHSPTACWDHSTNTPYSSIKGWL